MEATTYFDQGYEDQLEKLGFNIKGMASSVGNFLRYQVGGRARQFGQNVRDEAKGLLNRPVHPKQYSSIAGDAGMAPKQLQSALTTDKAGVGTSGISHLSGAGLEQRVSGALKDMDMRKARGDELFKRTYIPRNHSALKVPGEYRPAPRTVKPFPGVQPLPQLPVTQAGWRKPPQAAQQHSAVMPFRPTAVSQPPPMAVNQDMLSTRVASEVDMNYYEQGYADQMVQLGLYKDAGIKELAGKARDIGSRALGKSKETVVARRAAINSGRKAVTGARDAKELEGINTKFKTKVDEIKGTPKPTGNEYVPPPEIQAILDKHKPGAATAAASAPPPITPPAGTEAEGPGNWEKFKGWWGQRAPWQQVGMGAAVAAPVAAGLYMAGKDNPPSLAQQQMGYTPQY